MMYISTEVRQEIVEKYREINHCEGNSSSLEEAIFGYPTNRVLVDAAIRKANEEVDLERFAQYSPGWYNEVVANLPGVNELLAARLRVQGEEIKPEGTLQMLSQESLVYLAAAILLASRPFDKYYQDSCVATAKDLYAKVFKR